MPRGATKLRRTAIRQVSTKKAEWKRRYHAALAERKAAQVASHGHTYCEHCQKPGPVEGHHPGGQNGERILRFHLFNHDCHHWAHFVNPKQARAEGWLD